MAIFVLIHGANHGGWCWHKVKYHLESKGHTVIAPDLPGHSKTSILLPVEVTLESYVSFVDKILSDINEKVVLVGHSMGGAIITNVAEHSFQKIEKLIYICAFVPQDGNKIGELLDLDINSKLNGSYVVNEMEMKAELIEERLNEVVYNGCDREDVEFAMRHLVAQSLMPMVTPIILPIGHFKSIDRLGIVCTADKSITPDYQLKMYRASGCQIEYINSGHAPFFSKSQELSELLMGKIGSETEGSKF